MSVTAFDRKLFASFSLRFRRFYFCIVSFLFSFTSYRLYVVFIHSPFSLFAILSFHIPAHTQIQWYEFIFHVCYVDHQIRRNNCRVLCQTSQEREKKNKKLLLFFRRNKMLKHLMNGNLFQITKPKAKQKVEKKNRKKDWRFCSHSAHSKTCNECSRQLFIFSIEKEEDDEDEHVNERIVCLTKKWDAKKQFKHKPRRYDEKIKCLSFVSAEFLLSFDREKVQNRHISRKFNTRKRSKILPFKSKKSFSSFRFISSLLWQNRFEMPSEKDAPKVA